MAQESVSKLTAEKKVETKKINPTASLVRCVFPSQPQDFFIITEMHLRVGLNLKGKAQRNSIQILGSHVRQAHDKKEHWEGQSGEQNTALCVCPADLNRVIS